MLKEWEGERENDEKWVEMREREMQKWGNEKESEKEKNEWTSQRGLETGALEGVGFGERACLAPLRITFPDASFSRLTNLSCSSGPYL